MLVFSRLVALIVFVILGYRAITRRLSGRKIAPAIGAIMVLLFLGLILTPPVGTAARPTNGASGQNPSSVSQSGSVSASGNANGVAGAANGATNGAVLPGPAGSTSNDGTAAIAPTDAATPGSTDSVSTTLTGGSGSTTGAVPGVSSGSTMRVHFLDVGQGSATLFQIGDKVLVIDGGDSDRSSFVVAYLKKQGIQQVDVMVATHYDSDHLNGLVGILNVFPVKQVYDANYAVSTRVFTSFKSVIQTKRIPEAIPGMKQQIQVGDAVVTFVAPRSYGHSAENDDSICVRVAFGQTSFLIMGDPSADAEQQILTQNLKSDVFFSSHHGSDGSNSKTLLANVSPSFAVISCGAGNPYGHPGQNTLNRLKNTGAGLYRTDRQGTLICTSDGRTLSWSQPPGNDYTPGQATAAGTTTASAGTTNTAPRPTTAPQSTTITTTAAGQAQAYVLNTSTKKFHYPYCSSTAQISPANRKDVVMTRDAIMSQGYVACKICNP